MAGALKKPAAADGSGDALDRLCIEDPLTHREIAGGTRLVQELLQLFRSAADDLGKATALSKASTLDSLFDVYAAMQRGGGNGAVPTQWRPKVIGTKRGREEEAPVSPQGGANDNKRQTGFLPGTAAVAAAAGSGSRKRQATNFSPGGAAARQHIRWEDEDAAEAAAAAARAAAAVAEPEQWKYDSDSSPPQLQQDAQPHRSFEFEPPATEAASATDVSAGNQQPDVVQRPARPDAEADPTDAVTAFDEQWLRELPAEQKSRSADSFRRPSVNLESLSADQAQPPRQAPKQWGAQHQADWEQQEHEREQKQLRQQQKQDQKHKQLKHRKKKCLEWVETKFEPERVAQMKNRMQAVHQAAADPVAVAGSINMPSPPKEPSKSEQKERSAAQQQRQQQQQLDEIRRQRRGKRKKKKEQRWPPLGLLPKLKQRGQRPLQPQDDPKRS